VISVSDEQRQFLKLDGAPLPIVDYETDQCYMLMPVAFSRGHGRRVLARLPGVRAVGEADQPIEALATLALVIKDNLNRL
jgi:hypothetical protein